MRSQKRPHQKVKTGCTQCKKRRVKCDESRPACRNCVRYSKTCSFSSTANSQMLMDSTFLDLTSSQPRVTKPNLNLFDTSGFSYNDFELLHHWTISTAESLTLNKVLQQAIREVIPRLAIAYNYLMHAVLALSSLHIAYLRPAISDRYLILAAQHQGLAFPLIRSALTGVDEDNCHAIYAFGQVIAIYAIAIPQEPESQAGSSVIGTGLGFVPLLRSTFSMCDFALEWLSVGPFSSCLEKSPNLDDAPEFSQNPDDGKYARLLPFLRDNGSKDAHTCCKALNSLRGLLAIATAPNQSIDLKTLIFSWPAQVPQRYIFLIFKKNPGALVVMAHYCVMLNMIGSFWFMKGRAARLLEHCRNNLSDEWVHHVDWPLSIVGLPQDKQSMITI